MILAIVAALVVAGGAAFFMTVFSGYPKNRVSLSVALDKTREINKLYTGVYIIPALDRKFGTLKRDKPKEWFNTASGIFSISLPPNMTLNWIS